MTALPRLPLAFRGECRDDADARAVYSEAAGVARVMPRGVAVPADADDLALLAQWASEGGVPLIPRGAGSSMAGGAVGDGLIVDLGRLGGLEAPRKRASVSGGRTYAPTRLVAGAAVIRDDLQRAANSVGMSFPVDPSSSAFATVGGMVATHAAGSRTVRYGPLREWIEGVECVFADGTRGWVHRGAVLDDIPAIARFTRDVAPAIRAADVRLLRHEGVRKESSGYALEAYRRSGDVLDLLIGSEGTLAFITAVEVRLTPLPIATASLLAGFASVEAAATSAADLGALGASAVELLDRTFLEVAGRGGRALPVPDGLEAVLLIETEAPDEAAAGAAIAAIRQRCESGGAVHLRTALSAGEEATLWALRHAASPILTTLAPALQSLQLVEDGCVPPARFAEYVRAVRAALDRARFAGVIFGHAGDAHAHVNVLADVREPDWRSRCEQVLAEVTAAVARLGGTLAGEHGDGRLRTPLLPQVWPPETLALFAAVKSAFDPAGVLNPGVKVPAAGARALDAIKYDPALPPLPRAAREALELVTRERAYARSRLGLLPPPPAA